MTPEEQRRLHAEASTPDEVCALLRARGRTSEAHFVETLRPMISHDPVRGIRIIRERAESEEKIGNERTKQIAEAARVFDGRLARRLMDEEHAHLGQARAFSWAVKALTRGMAHGKLELGEQNKEAPCACGGQGAGVGGFHYAGAVGCLVQDGSDEPTVFESHRARNRPSDKA